MFEDVYFEAYDLLKKAIFNTVDDIINDKESIHTAIRSLLARAVEIDDALISKMETVLDDTAQREGYSNDYQ